MTKTNVVKNVGELRAILACLDDNTPIQAAHVVYAGVDDEVIEAVAVAENADGDLTFVPGSLAGRMRCLVGEPLDAAGFVELGKAVANVVQLDFIRLLEKLTALGYIVNIGTLGKAGAALTISRRETRFYHVLRVEETAEMMAELAKILNQHDGIASEMDAQVNAGKMAWDMLVGEVVDGAKLDRETLRKRALAACQIASRPNADLLFDAVADAARSDLQALLAFRRVVWFLQ